MFVRSPLGQGYSCIICTKKDDQISLADFRAWERLERHTAGLSAPVHAPALLAFIFNRFPKNTSKLYRIEWVAAAGLFVHRRAAIFPLALPFDSVTEVGERLWHCSARCEQFPQDPHVLLTSMVL